MGFDLIKNYFKLLMLFNYYFLIINNENMFDDYILILNNKNE